MSFKIGLLVSLHAKCKGSLFHSFGAVTEKARPPLSFSLFRGQLTITDLLI